MSTKNLKIALIAFPVMTFFILFLLSFQFCSTCGISSKTFLTFKGTFPSDCINCEIIKLQKQKEDLIRQRDDLLRPRSVLEKEIEDLKKKQMNTDSAIAVTNKNNTNEIIFVFPRKQ